MLQSEAKMKPIWYFVGLVLFSIGFIILLSGLYHLFVPHTTHKVLAHLYPDVWWGGLMTVSGVVFILLSRKSVVE